MNYVGVVASMVIAVSVIKTAKEKQKTPADD
jgi:hypothetical protein